MTMLFLLLGLAVLSAAALLRSQSNAAELSQSSWEALIAKLQPVPTTGIIAVAREYLNPVKGQIDTEPEELWERIGGIDGLEHMRANADVLLALAACAEQWNRVESRIVGERMRRDAVALRRAVRGITISMYLDSGRGRAAFHVHEAASAYYLMRQRLLALYETSHAARLPALSAAV